MKKILDQYRYILNKRQKIYIVIIIFMMILGAALETIGVGMIGPLIAALMNADQIMNNKYVSVICNLFHINSSNSFIIIMIITFIIFYLIRGLYLYLLLYIQYRFVYNSRYFLQRRLMKIYLSRPYEFYLKASSGEIVNSLTNDVPLTFDMLVAMLSFLTEAIVVVVIFVAIIVINPFMAISIAVILGILMLIIFKGLKPILSRAGVDFQEGMSLSNKWILQSVSGIKEVKTGRKEEYFIEEYSKYGKRAVNAQRKSNLFSNIPRISIETISVITILAILGIMFWSGNDFFKLLPQLSAFAVAAIRILPGVNRMSTYRNQMAYYEPMLNKTITIVKNAEEWQKTDSKNTNSTVKALNLLTLTKDCELCNITFSYPDSNRYIFKNASMKIPVGKSVGMIGTSGSGKSTAINILLGLLKPQYGEVLSDGIDIELDYTGWLSHIGYIPQMIYMLDDTVRRNVAFGYKDDNISDELVWKALDDAKLGDYIRTLPDGLDTGIGESGIRLSGGQRQRIGIARALYENPEMLIFDEATSSLDNQTEADIMDSINNLHGKKTMLIIAHRMATIADCDLVYEVKNDKILRVR